jgi:XTP/dITP diphosphohydrolase
MTKLVVATENPGKRREIAIALGETGIEVVGLDAVADRTPVTETGETFAANARLKAEAWSRRTDLPVLADDSGLEVDALGGEPGVRSARYGGPGLDDAARTRLVLERLAGVRDPSRRTARFVCVLAVAREGRTVATFAGTVEGRIADAPRGTNGFGYDPIFYHPPSGCTTAELSTEAKQAISHRGQALARLVEALRRGDRRLVHA